MVLPYKLYEKEVFDWLKSKNNQDPDFTFSLRQVGSKGSERDYFIGTEKSTYFATTFWTIPVAFPGAATDLIDLIFRYVDSENYGYYFQFYQKKEPHNEQNRLGLELLNKLRPIIKEKLGLSYESSPEHKMERFLSKSPKEKYGDISKMFRDIENDLNIILPLVDNEIEKLKNSNNSFVGHRITRDEFKSYTDKLELRLKKYSDIRSNNVSSQNKIDLNTILYGPPGTGKTYSTINKALSITNPEFDLNQSRDIVKTEFQRQLEDGQIAFCTFHQSMTYEDFIEGIKPIKSEDNEGTLKYDIEPGIFKKICESAKSLPHIKIKVDWDAPKYYKMSLGGKNRPDIHEWCISNDLIGLGWGGSSDLKRYTTIEKWDLFRDTFNTEFADLVKESRFNIQATYAFLHMKPNDVVVISKGNYIIDAIGIVKGDYFYDDSKNSDFYHYRKVEWIAKNLDTSPERFFNKKISQATIYEFDAADIKKDSFKQLTHSINKEEAKKYVLIIDEINRGNVSQIFGELITLIEDNKRLGNAEALEVILPYSKKKFGVPSNLYIIGTMNTADRSVEALDTALRRRFSFEEISPNPKLLNPSLMMQRLWFEYADLDWNDPEWLAIEKEFLNLHEAEIIDRAKYEEFENTTLEEDPELDLSNVFAFNGISLESLLYTINNRVQKLLDRDHQIGHSYFINVKNISELKDVFQNKIIPLLQEYFYGDYSKIGMILGGSFVEVEANDNSNVFASDFVTEVSSDYEIQKTYSLKSVQEMTDNDFMSALKNLLK